MYNYLLHIHIVNIVIILDYFNIIILLWFFLSHPCPSISTISHQNYETVHFVILSIVSQHAYTEEYEQQRGKGSFPAMITPGYQMAKKANDMASDVSFENLLPL